MNEELLEKIMNLIMHGGDAKSFAMQAIASAKNNDFEAAEKELDAANEALLLAHNSQTDMIQEEAKGNQTPVSLLMVHGQDHLMNAITFLDLAREIVDLYRKLA